MCWCTPEIRTPWCGKPGCHPPLPVTAPAPSESRGGAPERMLKFFAFGHLRPDLQRISQPFFDLAHLLALTVPAGPERTVALRKLLEAKDAAVRAVAIPEGT